MKALAKKPTIAETRSTSALRERLRRRYDQLCNRAIGRIREGRIELDRVLQTETPDARRGLTVIARPSPEVRRQVAVFLRGLRQLEPSQYYYETSEYHITILSLFTATTDFGPFIARKGAYVAAVDAALEAAEPIRITFEKTM
jgi:hypothetical protein